MHTAELVLLIGRVHHAWRFAIPGQNVYLEASRHPVAPMRAFEFCLPTSATSVPDRPIWLHEVKYDGLYEGHVVKKFFAISISSFPTFQEGSGERSSALMAR